MMLRFQWDSLRRGDHILVHDVRSVELGLRPAVVELGLRPAVVELVDSTGPRRDIAVRYIDGPDAGRVVRPGRFASHPAALDDADLGALSRCVDAIAA
jgi:hypothetical protein